MAGAGSNFTVSSNLDDGSAGRLRAAIIAANANSGTTIRFDSALAGSTITLTSELPLILGNNTVIDGGSNDITVSGNDLFRVFFIGGAGQAGEPAATAATIENLTIANANAKGGDGSGGGAGLGGAIFV